MGMESWISNLSQFQSRTFPEKEAIYDYDTKMRYTYADIEFRSNVLGNYLMEELNVQKGDRIAFCTRNCIELIDAYYATAKTGTILVTYNPFLSETELVQMINHEQPRVLLYEDMFASKVNRLKSHVRIENHIVLTNGLNKENDITYEEIMSYENNVNLECKDLDLNDIRMILHTGGTTGTPKGAKISYRSLLFNAMSGIVTMGLSDSDSTYVMLPLFHTGAWNGLTLPLLHAGGRIVINKCFDPKTALEIINKEKPTTLLGVSTMFRMMTSHSEFESTDFSSLRWAMSGAAPTPKEIMERFWEKGVKLVIAYGMTEAGASNLFIKADDMHLKEIKEKHESVGKPMYFNEVRIVNDDGHDVKTNECGEVIFSGPLIFSGYWNDEEESNRTLKNNWVYTGDIAKVDDEGFYYIVGRKKNMYITGGENIFPSEVEEVLYKHPSIYEVCVIGVPDKKWGEVGKAVIAPKPGHVIDEEELKDFLKGRIASIKIPKSIEVIEQLPKNSAGKIQRGFITSLYGSFARES